MEKGVRGIQKKVESSCKYHQAIKDQFFSFRQKKRVLQKKSLETAECLEKIDKIIL